jgi:probable phosphoglycerate mutase
MTMFYLIRHGATDAIGKTLAGWTPGIHLNDAGRSEVAELADRFKDVPLTAIYSSPLERTRETAEVLARRFSLNIEFTEEIGEVHYGEWTGRSAAELLSDPYWHEYNRSRSTFRIPGGELAPEVQTRVVNFLANVRVTFPAGHVAVVSHGDPIKTAVMHYLGISLNMFRRIEISPASVTVIRDDTDQARVLAVNTLDVSLSRYLVYA